MSRERGHRWCDAELLNRIMTLAGGLLLVTAPAGGQVAIGPPHDDGPAARRLRS